MSDLGCPFVAGPACRDCDGSCWEPAQQGPPQPEPCEVCSRISGFLMDCDGWCHRVDSQESFEEARRRYDRHYGEETDMTAELASANSRAHSESQPEESK